MLRKWQKKPCACGTRDSTNRNVVVTRSRIALGSCQPRWSAMHSAVKPKPVAAMLATFLESGPAAWLRSFTRPVDGFTSSQKNWKQACSSSSKKASSCGVNRYRVGSPFNSAVVRSADDPVSCPTTTPKPCPTAACNLESPANSRDTPAATREAMRNQSRRESLLLLTRGSPNRHASAGQRGSAGETPASSTHLQNFW